MKAVFIVLLFPSLAYGFFKDIPYKRTEICDKIKTDYNKADADHDKASADFSKALDDHSKANDNIKKYCK